MHAAIPRQQPPSISLVSNNVKCSNLSAALLRSTNNFAPTSQHHKQTLSSSARAPAAAFSNTLAAPIPQQLVIAVGRPCSSNIFSDAALSTAFLGNLVYHSANSATSAPAISISALRHQQRPQTCVVSCQTLTVQPPNRNQPIGKSANF